MYSEKFNDLARKNNFLRQQMALAFVNSREFLTSNIIGATNLEQPKKISIVLRLNFLLIY